MYSVLFYSLVVVLLFVAKPPVMFDKDASVKLFGIGNNKTVFSFGVFVTVAAMLSFYIFAMIDLVFARSL
jgi:hypothetical protein